MLISLKWKIQLWHTLILGIVLACLAVGFYHYVKEQKVQELDRWLDQQIAPLGGLPLERPNRHNRMRRASAEATPTTTKEPVGAPLASASTAPVSPALEVVTLPGWEPVSVNIPSIAGDPIERSLRPQQPRNAFVENYVPIGFYAIVINLRTGEVEFKTTNTPDIELPLGHRRSYFVRFRDDRYREILYTGPVRKVLIGADTAQFQNTLFNLKLQIAGGAFGILLFGIGIGQVLVARSLSPIKSIVQTTQKITKGDLSERVSASQRSNTTEILELTEGLNQTFDKLEFLFDRQLRFTADASHELRTPLTALLAQLEHGLDPGRSREELNQVLEVSSRSADRIRRITEQLMELAHYDTKRVELDYIEMPIDEFLSSLVEEITPYASKHGSQITTDLASGAIHCDPFRIHQVITNLINNALQHNSDPIQISLRAYNKENHTYIKITDNGKGIRSSNVDKLFDRFYQETESRTTLNGRHNIGLGLSICQAIIQAHGGSIEVTSEPKVATTFSITIPKTSNRALN